MGFGIPFIHVKGSVFLLRVMWAKYISFPNHGPLMYLGFRVWGLGFGILGLSLRGWDLGFRASGLGRSVWDSVFRIQGFGLKGPDQALLLWADTCFLVLTVKPYELWNKQGLRAHTLNPKPSGAHGSYLKALGTLIKIVGQIVHILPDLSLSGGLCRK